MNFLIVCFVLFRKQLVYSNQKMKNHMEDLIQSGPSGYIAYVAPASLEGLVWSPIKAIYQNLVPPLSIRSSGFTSPLEPK